MTINKTLKEQLLKEGIDPLNLPIGDYSNIEDISEIIEILEDIRPKEQTKENISDIQDIQGIEVYHIDPEEIYIKNLDNVSDLKEIILTLKDKISHLEATGDTERGFEGDNNINSQIDIIKGSEEVSEVLYFDISGKEGYKIPIPSHKTILSNRSIDFKLLYIMACNCSRYREDDNSPYMWFITKDAINNSVKPLYNRHKDTFNKKLKVLKDIGLFTEDKDSGDFIYNYDKYKLFVRYDIEKLLNLILSDEIKENSYRILTYLLIYCKGERKTLSYEFIVKGIGLKNLNRQTIKDLLEPLKVNDIIRVNKIIAPVGVNKFVTKNYYEII